MLEHNHFYRMHHPLVLQNEVHHSQPKKCTTKSQICNRKKFQYFLVMDMTSISAIYIKATNTNQTGISSIIGLGDILYIHLVWSSYVLHVELFHQCSNQ